MLLACFESFCLLWRPETMVMIKALRGNEGLLLSCVCHALLVIAEALAFKQQQASVV